jgi:hypothetical protein
MNAPERRHKRAIGRLPDSGLQSVDLAETEGFEPSIGLYNPITV